MTENLDASQVQEQAPQEPVEVNTQEVETPAQETEPTSEQPTTEPQAQEPVEDGKPKPIIEGLTYTSQEELVKGVKSKDDYIETLKAENLQLKARQEAEANIYQQLGYQNESQFKNAQVEQQITQAYNQDLEAIVAPFMRYIDAETPIATIQDIVEALPSSLASDLSFKMADLNQRLDTTRQNINQKLQTEQQQAFEQHKNSLYDTHKEHKDILDLFFDSQPTVEKAISLKDAIEKQAVEKYKASLELAKQNEEAISKLPKANGTTVNGQPKTDYSTEELATLKETDPEAFAKWCRS